MNYDFKILNGATPKSGKTLCLSCAQATRRIGQNLEEEIFCSSYNLSAHGSHKVPFRVSECTDYRAFNTPDKQDMEKIAWIVQVRTRGAAGFQGPSTELEIVPPKKEES